MTDYRALAAQYIRIYGTESDNDYIRGGKPMKKRSAVVVVPCPDCGMQATVREDGKGVLLDRWRDDHVRAVEWGRARAG